MHRAIVVHPFFKELILTHKKKAVMQQVDLIRDQQIVFFCREETNPPSEVAFATATIKEGAILKINPVNESMQRQVAMGAAYQWVGLNKETIAKVIWNEGFAHPDDFWNNLDKRKNKVIIVTQFYFDEVQPVIDPKLYQYAK